MKYQPDKLFRDTLYGYARPAPANAWAKVSSNMERNGARVAWLRLAATIVVIVTSGLILYPVIRQETPAVPTRTAAVTADKNGRDLDRADAVDKAVQMADIGDKASPKSNIAAHQRSDTSKKKTQIARPVSADRNEDIPLATPKEPEPVTLAQAQSKKTLEQPTFEDEAKPRRKTVTIVLSPDDVNAKYLQKPVEAHATSGRKDASGLQHVLDKAMELKHNQDPLGELRYKKDQILAMNFK